MRAIRTVLAAICIFALGTVALALTPAQRAVLRTISPVASFNFVGASTAALPSWFCGTSTATCGPTATVRSSNATQFDSTGKQTYGPNNLEPYSFQFSSWSTNQSTVSAAGIVLPDGTTGGYKITDNGSASTHTIYTNVSSGVVGQNIIQVVEAKASDLSWIKLLEGNQVTATAWFDLTNGVVGTVSGTGSPTAGIISLGNGWYRCWMRYTLVSTGAYNNQIGPAPSNGSYSYTGTGKGIYVAYSSISAVTYETAPRSQDLVQTNGSAYYGARFDYDPNTLAAQGLLIEEGRTNLSIQSGALTNAAWTLVRAATSTDGTTFLDGTTATKFTMANSALSQYITSASAMTTTSGSNYATSWYVKPGTQNFFYITNSDAADGTKWASAVFDLSTTANGTASQTGVGAGSGTVTSTKKTYLGNGWFRLVLVSNHNTTSTNTACGFAGAATGNTYSNYGVMAATLNGQTAYLAQPQTELGSFETSQIYTGSASVARAADVMQLGGVALATATGPAATAFLEVGNLPTQTGVIRYMQYGAGSGLLISMTSNSLTTIYEQNTSGAASVSATAGSGSAGTILRAGVTWGASGGRKLVASGGAIAVDASNSELATGAVNIGQGQSTAINGYMRSFAIYNSRLPDVIFQRISKVGASFLAADLDAFPRYAANDNLPIIWKRAM